MPLFKQLHQLFKQLVFLLAIFVPKIETSEKDIFLNQISYIYYFI